MRFIIIIALALYVVYKIGTLFFKAGAASQQLRNQQRKNFNGEDPEAPRKPKGNNFKGGEYVDYEDIK